MLRIRLRRVGKKKQPSYRIVVADSRKPRDGAFVETLGHYHPLDNPSTIVIDADRARHWLDRGAQPSDRVAKLLAIQGIAEIPAKLKTRIELGNQRAKEAAKKKKEEEPAAPEEPSAKPEAKAEAPTAEPKAPAAAADEPPAEAEAEAPPADAKAEPDQEKAAAEAEAEAPPAADEAAEEEKPDAGEASKDEKPAADEAAGDGEEQTKE